MTKKALWNFCGKWCGTSKVIWIPFSFVVYMDLFLVDNLSIWVLPWGFYISVQPQPWQHKFVDARKSYFKAHATQLKSVFLKEFSEHRPPEQGISHLERSGKALLTISPQLSQLFLSFLTRLSLLRMRENVFPKIYKELNNLASQNFLQKSILVWQLFLKWICRSSEAL